MAEKFFNSFILEIYLVFSAHTAAKGSLRSAAHVVYMALYEVIFYHYAAVAEEPMIYRHSNRGQQGTLLRRRRYTSIFLLTC